jgi:hypothetical protein
MVVEPVPFRIPLPGKDTLDLDGARSVTARVEGLLHLDTDVLSIEWRRLEHVEEVTLGSVSIDDDATLPEWIDIPLTWLADARLSGGWWAPRLRLRMRRLDAFDALPGAKQGEVTVRIARGDRALAAAFADAIVAHGKGGG